jgi:hypothetical protein
MGEELTDADVLVLLTTLLNRMADGGVINNARYEIDFLIAYLERAPHLDNVEQKTLLLVQADLNLGHLDRAAIRICSAITRRLSRAH